jgi:[ribosomal protein S5]-alanine N-acetyltransferase
MTNTIETARTRLRPFEESDAEAAFAWFSDPEVMRFIPRGPDGTVEDTRRRIASYRAHQSQFGFSKWLITDRQTGQPVGDSGLMHLPDGKRIELGYRLARPFWGTGLALEVARGWLEWFDTHLTGTPLFADCHAEHLRSHRILTTLGFVPLHPEDVWGLTMTIYRRVN